MDRGGGGKYHNHHAVYSTISNARNDEVLGGTVAEMDMHIRRSGQLQGVQLFEDHVCLNWNERSGGNAVKRWGESGVIGIYIF